MGEANDETALEGELETHLEENRASLQAVDEALAVDFNNSELIMIREELQQAVKGAEESLLHLKRARLLREVDAMTQRQESPSEGGQIEVADELPQSVSRSDMGDVVPPQPFSVGSKCRFRHSDGRWYNGCILGMEDDSVARVAFLHPTSEKLQMCRFFLQQQCRFGNKCRLSHGLEAHLNALRNYEAPEWKQIPLGSAVLAEAGNGLWRAAELELWDEGQQRATIVFSADGKRMDVDKDDLAQSEYALLSDASDTSDEDGDESDDFVDEEERPTLGSFCAGVQTETVTFANWEKHTRGVASKMMASMGFREGMGLGVSGQGIIQPVKVQMRPAKQSLGFGQDNQDGEQGDAEKTAKKKKSRGGKRKRDQKWANAQRAAKSKMEVIEETRNVFDFINHHLTGQQVSATKSSKVRPGGSQTNCSGSVSDKQSLEKANRQTIVAHEDEIKELRSKVSKLQEMATRNRKEKVVYEAVGRKLVEARKALASAEAAHATTTHAVNSKEKERKWLRF
ncbi:zinc finger CCCH domain-containing protein 18 [Physcomitrium patens]|uniref:Zinc finger CCCH-type with G patch domain-containing protein n=1 Tax=Physcomitrium patens TaxID=3218 RepID=A9RTG1_PHYPA|nr:zinc finger CCCH domain-containing protein 18-like [Physcomitrium patens]PNR31654.1 hypothetical protein PHYPA_025775 [Physcomitrium patens]|eukprot:XP_024359042.1 zinc finger CCCH domain-containing protein 18-like [Physcomitrella patens]